MSGLFPLLDSPRTPSPQGAGELARDVLWDFEMNRPVWRGGNPVWVTGAAAVKSWAARAVRTVRREKDIFSADYGSDVQSLTGRPFSEEVRQSEATRLVRECLGINPHIKDVQQIRVEFQGAELSIACTMMTDYGEVALDGRYI